MRLLIPRFVLCVLPVWGVAFSAEEPGALADWREWVADYCWDCHDSLIEEAELDLETILDEDPEAHAEIWESVLRRLTARQMPPADEPRRPSEAEYQGLIEALETRLDRAAENSPRPGRVDSIRRLTRREYANAIEDIFGLQIQPEAWLPADSESHGFDNVTLGDLSPLRLNRFLDAAQAISQLVVGGASDNPIGETIRIAPDITQEKRAPGAPLGTRGGTVFERRFPEAGFYEFSIRLARDRNEHVEGMREAHTLDILIDRARVARFEIERPGPGLRHEDVDRHLKARVPVQAGTREVAVVFVAKPDYLDVTKRQPYQARYNYHRHPRRSPAVFQVSYTGPYESEGASSLRPAWMTPYPESEAQEESSARAILARLARLAYRRPVEAEDLEGPMRLYREGRELGDFQTGLKEGLAAILANPSFLLRFEKDPRPDETDARGVAMLTDLELASRLSFFIWSSVPDDRLLSLAERGALGDPSILFQETKRLLADPRAERLATDFVGQWLRLNNLEAFVPNLRDYPDFDDNLRQAFRVETESLFQKVLMEDRSIADLLRTETTTLNERLAKHYGIPHVYGTRFRAVDLPEDSGRGGLLRHGSILTVTSYATRTSPVIRGNWVLENILGTPAPPPPPDIPALEDQKIDASLPIRDRLAAHREDKACAVCHNLTDPVGFALEGYDAIGRRRVLENGQPVDASGGLPDGAAFDGVAGLEEALLQRPELFARTLTEKLMTFATGRGVESFDGPEIRKIVRRAAREDFRLQSIIVGVVESAPFKMRESP